MLQLSLSINNASPYSNARAHIYNPKDQQSIWLEKVGKAVSLTYHGNSKRIYQKSPKNAPMFRLYQRRLGLHR